MCFFFFPYQLFEASSALLLLYSQTQSPAAESAAAGDVSATEGAAEHAELSEFFSCKNNVQIFPFITIL